MAYPPAYDRTFSFTDWEAANPGEPKPGSDLDSEFDAVSNALTATQDNLALIQRSDGALANDSVGEDQLQDGLLDGIVDGVTADAEAAAAAAAASAAAAAGSASSAATSASDAAAQVAIAAGHAASAGVSQGIAQGAATAAAASADEAGMAADVSITAATSTENSVAQAQLHEEMAFKWAEYLAAPVMPAPPGWPEAVDDGMFSAKWWALRARDYNEVHEYDFGTAGANPGEAFDIWDLTNDLEDPPGLVYMTWGSPPRTYVLTDPSNPSDPNSWMDITGADGPPGPIGPIGPPGPPNTLTIGTVTTGLPGTPADATITGTAPNQVLNMTIPAGADGTGTTLVAASGTIGLTAVPGAATTAARSDSTPPLSQAIAPTWTSPHTFVGTDGYLAVRIRGGDPALLFYDDDGALHAKGTVMEARGGVARIGFTDDTIAVQRNFLEATRAGNAVATVAFGNATDNPAYNFLGTGTATFNGTVDLLGPLRATGVDGVAGQVLSTQGAGLPPVWRTSSGGSIELGYNFSTSVGTANPGSQKLSLNSAVYASVTVAVFNALAMTNFDANTILSLLTTGNRIYIQQRNDASKAVVYEVTGPGTNLTGYWTIPVTIIQSRGTLFSANADLNCVFILSVSSSSLANPTALVGLTAVNGSATSGMRSDGAPALSQAIVPTWSGAHTFAFPGSGATPNILVSSPAPNYGWYEDDAAVNNRRWDIRATSEQWLIRALSDDGATSSTIFYVDRTATAVDSLNFGNATNNPTYNFLGTGLTTFGGNVAGVGGTWSAQHTFASNGASGNASWAIKINSPLPVIGWSETTAAADSKVWADYIGTQVRHFSVFNDAFSVGVDWLAVSRSLNTITNLAFGNATNNPTYNFLGNGVVTTGGVVRGPNATYSAPTYSWTASPNTGVYLNAVNDMVFVAGGNTVARGYLGGGGTVPAWQIVDGTIGVPGLQFNADPTTGLWRAGVSDIGFSGGGVDMLRVRPDGLYARFGIKNSDGTAGSPSYSFNSDTDSGMFLGASNTLHFATGGVTAVIISNSTVYLQDGSAAASSIRWINDQDLGIYRHGADTIGFSAAGVLRVAINANGLYAVDGSAANPSISFLLDQDTGIHRYAENIGALGAGGSAVFLWSPTALYLRARTLGLDGGPTAPSYSFESSPGFGMFVSGTALGFSASGVNVFYITSTTAQVLGNLAVSGAASAASFTSTSARAIKRETGSPRKPANILARLRPLLYRLLDGDEREQLGLIAEEVHEVCPQLSDGKTVAYDRLAILLLAAWQDEHLEAA